MPTYPYFNGTSILSLVKYVNNDLTGGLFISLTLLSFPVIIFIAMKQNNVSTPRAYAVSMFMLFILFWIFLGAGLLPSAQARVYIVVIVLLSLVGFALKSSETQFD